MARSTPRVEQEKLVLPATRSPYVVVGSQQWFSWLAQEENGSFFFAHGTESFTARKERRQRGGRYWIAYRSREGRLSKTYIGRSEDLTPERLREVASLLASQKTREQSNARPDLSIVASKFAPPPLASRKFRLIERTKLLAKLNESLDSSKKLTLVTAPAGFGKTTLLSMWYEACRRQHGNQNTIAWIALDERDNDPHRFWSTIWSALCREQDGASSLPLSSTPQMSIETVLAALLNGSHHGALILDDYHAITNPKIHEEMAFLLTHLPDDIHLVLASRNEPALPLGRARMYGELNELRAEDLRLRGDEIAHFLREVVGINLSPDETALLEQRTEGWIAGLHLVGQALREQSIPGGVSGDESGGVLARFSGSQRSLFDYFAEEVFARQSAQVQRFLLHTALLTELTPPLCAAMLYDDDNELSGGEANARVLLDQLERANAFVVPLDEQRQRYRYHALFSEFLQEKLKRSAPALIAQLHRRAARWYARQGMSEEAIEHSLAAQDQQQARHLIEQVGEEMLWKRGEVRRLLAWMQKLALVHENETPRLELLYAWSLLLSGQRDLAEVAALLDRLESREEEISGELRGDIAALRARIAAFYDDIPQVIVHSRRALQELPRERALLRADVAFGLGGTYNGRKELDEAYLVLSEALHISQALGSMRTAMFASRYLASVCVEQGRLTEAEAIHRQALHFAGEHTRLPASGIVHSGWAELLYERNELDQALHHARLGIELGEGSGEIKAVLAGYSILAQLLAARGEIEQAWQEVWRIERIAMLGRIRWQNEQIAAISIRLALLQGDVVRAKRALRKLEIDPDAVIDQAPAAELESQRLMLARIWLAEGRNRDVLALLEPIVQAARQQGRVRAILAAQALQAVALHSLGERQQAVHILRELLRLAAPEGYARTLLDIGVPLTELLQRIELSGSVRSYARRLLAVDGNNGNDARVRNDVLSGREHEVLHLLTMGRSNQEIAELLVVAPSTVKAHVKHICQKLGAQNRLQAVARARELGLF